MTVKKYSIFRTMALLQPHIVYSITNALTVFGIAINRKFHEINDKARLFKDVV